MLESDQNRLVRPQCPPQTAEQGLAAVPCVLARRILFLFRPAGRWQDLAGHKRPTTPQQARLLDTGDEAQIDRLGKRRIAPLLECLGKQG